MDGVCSVGVVTGPLAIPSPGFEALNFSLPTEVDPASGARTPVESARIAPPQALLSTSPP